MDAKKKKYYLTLGDGGSGASYDDYDTVMDVIKEFINNYGDCNISIEVYSE